MPETTETTHYRLVWGDGGERYSDNLDALLSRASADFGDRIESRTVVTRTGDWEQVYP